MRFWMHSRTIDVPAGYRPPPSIGDRGPTVVWPLTAHVVVGPEEAVEVYETNLSRYPENGWALHGLAECLARLGREEDAAAAKSRFDLAWTDADIVIPGSCFCRTKAAS